MADRNIIYDILDFTWDKDTNTFIGYANILRPVQYTWYYNKKRRCNILGWKLNKLYSLGDFTFPSHRGKFYIANVSSGNKYRFILRKDHGEYLEFTTECKTYTCKVYV